MARLALTLADQPQNRNEPQVNRALNASSPFDVNLRARPRLTVGEALNMESILSIVEDVFEIERRGCVVIPGIPCDTRLKVKVGDTIRLVRPDATDLITKVLGIEMFGGVNQEFSPMLLGPELRKSEIPIGTQLFLREPNEC